MNWFRLTLALVVFLTSYTLSAQVNVKGYYRSDGTYVRPHTRSSPSRSYSPASAAGGTFWEPRKEVNCSYGQCNAIALSTSKRCEHCVSKFGDRYCWQHPINKGSKRSATSSSNVALTAVDLGYFLNPDFGSGLGIRLYTTGKLDMLMTWDYAFNPKEFWITRSIISSGDVKLYEYDVYNSFYIGTLTPSFKGVEGFIQLGGVAGFKRGVFKYQRNSYEYTERINGSTYSEFSVKTGLMINTTNWLNLSIGYTSMPETMLLGVYFKL